MVSWSLIVVDLFVAFSILLFVEVHLLQKAVLLLYIKMVNLGSLVN